MAGIYGAPPKLVFYRVRKNTGGTAYEIVQPTGTTLAATEADAVHIITELEQSQLQPQDDGTFQIVLDNHDATPEFFDNLINPYARAVSGSTGTAPAAWKRQDGKERDGSVSASGDLLLAIPYGPLNSATTRLMYIALGGLAKSSGGAVYKDGEWIKPGVTFKSVGADFDLTILEDLFDGALLKLGVGGIGNQVIPQYGHFITESLLKP